MTGAAQGLGYAAAARLAADGATVALLDRDGEKLRAAADALGAQGLTVLPHTVDLTSERPRDSVPEVEDVLRFSSAHYIPADLTRDGEPERLVTEAWTRLGSIDVLVNNVGIYPHRPFEELTYAEWRRVLAVNLDSVFLCSHAVYPDMRKRGYGRIVNVSSSTFFIGYPGLAAYIASKGGIIGFTRALASEAGPYGITVNAVTPGLIATEGVLEGEEAGLFDEIVPEQALPRRGEPEDIAECIAYLASPAAGFITGQTINVDGGHRFH